MAVYGTPIVPIGGKASKGSQMFLAVTLPRSIYYEQASEWLKIKDDPKDNILETHWDGQVVCGGNLWKLNGNSAFCYSLEDGELLETIDLSPTAGQYYSSAIDTDGQSRIWFVRINHSVNVSTTKTRYDYVYDIPFYLNIYFNLYELNITSKSIKLLFSASEKTENFYNHSCYGIKQLTRQGDYLNSFLGFLKYSKISNKLYLGNLIGSRNWVSYVYFSKTNEQSNSITLNFLGSKAFYEYDLEKNEYKKLANYNGTISMRGQFAYDTEDFLYVGNGYSVNDKEKIITRYNKLSNTWETITTIFEGYNNGPFAYINLGDKILQVSQTATGVFDPLTGNLDPSPVPVIPPDEMVIYPCFKAYSNNILYLITNKGIYKCPFYTNIPEDAPIVCKIYKGQKYHTIEPFEIPNKISLKRTQQIAEQDIEIKMYEYSSEGGQTIYIEDTGEGK